MVNRRAKQRGQSNRQQIHKRLRKHGPASKSELADLIDVSENHVVDHYLSPDDNIEYDKSINPPQGKYKLVGDVEPDEKPTEPDDDAVTEDEDPPWQDTPVADEDPSESNLTERERYILQKLQTGTSEDTLADDLGTRPSIVHQHLRELRADGWKVYRDDTAGHVTLAGDHAIRSSEHKGTRTRKANQWWERRHSALVRDFKTLETPTADIKATPNREDWVHVIGDIHAGDEVFTPDGENVYDINTVPRIVRYDTEKSLELAEYHNAEYDAAHLLWNGDFVTNEGIYTGQFEDLDAWLDQQHDMLMEPLLEQVKAYSERFPVVNVVCQVGNHGKNRADGTSKHANADLILYKSIRNAIAAVRKYGDGDIFENVNFQIGEARPYVNFPLRGGKLRGHLRHGDDRPPQANTRMGSDKWKTTLLNHEFDLAFINHHHVSGEIPWDGPPVVVSGTPKPPGDFVDKIAAATSLDPAEHARRISHCLGVADHGETGIYPVKTHDFDYLEPTATEQSDSEFVWQGAT